MWKTADAIGSGTADPVHSQAAVSSSPTPVMANKPAPGRRGPNGIAPRTTYSRVNSGTPLTPDTSGINQKGSTPRGLEFLPPKVAEDYTMSQASRPSLQDMIKAAMDGTLDRLSVAEEATRQLAAHTGVQQTKTASASADHIATEQIHKLASAVEYIAEMLKQAEISLPKPVAGQGPGAGPGALTVMHAKSSGPSLDTSDLGHGTPAGQPPMSPSTQGEKVQSGKANTGLETNDSMMHREQPVEPITNQKTKKASLEGNLARFGLAAQADVPVGMIRKLAEDAINPARISAGAAVPPDASESGQGVPAEPSDVTSQKNMISSNQAAINYTKQQAKADPKSDVNQVFTQPALSKAHDPVLHHAFDNTSNAGVKISSAKLTGEATKIAAARALLSKLAEEACKDEPKDGKKQKQSQIGSAPSNPAAASGFTASSLG